MISKGVELNLQNAWTDNVYTSLGIMYNDARYADDVQRSDGLPAGALAGAQLTHAPEWSVTGTLNWEMPLEAWKAGARLRSSTRAGPITTIRAPTSIRRSTRPRTPW